ncbi:hypothetical protein Cf24236_1859 [Citrobacter farmeri]|uniref:hypothetical protein n=1 Tax=Citrobacter farmeri TaxID=67824 RepID=UPI001C99EB85|nr:hypothetical protein [Citrobacter farmeri]QZE46620.1 hypothetical protein Cf24236_1859 [Citrobacter farmeri]
MITKYQKATHSNKNKNKNKKKQKFNFATYYFIKKPGLFIPFPGEKIINRINFRNCEKYILRLFLNEGIISQKEGVENANY